MFAVFPIQYYWCVYQSEWATDLLFRDAQTLARLYPRFVHHGLTSFASPDVMRFLGRKSPNQGQVHPAFKGEIVTSLKRRPEGVRIKHTVNNNSIKLYDKQGSVLRVETTLNNSRDLKVYRRSEGQRRGARSWKRMRKGIADLHRRAQLSQAANERYLDALAAVSKEATLGEFTRELCRARTHRGKRIRAIRPLEPQELLLLKTISQGEFLITGVRNRDIVSVLFPKSVQSPDERKRARAAVSYRLRILRAHGIIAKISNTHRYLITAKGRTAIAAILSAQQATIEQLTKMAA